MTKIYLVRHGETLFNIKNRVQGWCDSPLTQKGIIQAKILNDKLRNIPFVQVYSSSSERAVDTANYIIEGRELPLTLMKKLKEQNYGTLEGEKNDILRNKSNNEVKIEFGMIVERMLKGFKEYGGENYDILIKRLMDSLNEIIQECPEGNVLVVTHGGAILAITYHLMNGKGLDGLYPPENCSITILNYDGQFKVEDYNRRLN